MAIKDYHVIAAGTMRGPDLLKKDPSKCTLSMVMQCNVVRAPRCLCYMQPLIIVVQTCAATTSGALGGATRAIEVMTTIRLHLGYILLGGCILLAERLYM